jgi:tRNA pseudouridine55 synthase
MMIVRTTGLPTEDAGLPGDAMLLVDKPLGWTSFDVVNKIRAATGIRRVGHAGTLDPLATGLLIVCTGRMTKELGRYTGLEKTYTAVLTLGGTTESYDAATPVVDPRDTSGVSPEMIRDTVASFIGRQTQLPPMWSAVKVGGRRLYRYARTGQTVVRPPREIEIHRITVDRIEMPRVTITVVCSKGTYIRTLAHDIGVRLGCGAYVSALRRTAIGPFDVDQARTVQEITDRSASPAAS